MRVLLQRTSATAGADLGYVWDLAFMDPDELVRDVVAAYERAGRDFFSLWVDPQRAWEELHAEVNDEKSDVDGAFIGSPYWFESIATIEFYMKVAARLGKVQEDIDMLHKSEALHIRECGLDELGEPYETRLNELRAMLND